jgi:mannosyltransferase
MSAAAPASTSTSTAPGVRAGRELPSWWPLAALTLLAAILRLSTLDLQSFWYDEAFTPVHVLHASLSATLRSISHTENSPPLWYLLAWADSRILGNGEIALRLPSALAGIATVPVAWGIGRELADRRTAIVCAALVAVNPLFVWYSQEARAYGLFVLTSTLATLCFLRARREPSARRMAWFAFIAALALLSHYFAVFLLAPMALWLLAERSTRRAALAALVAVAVVGVALLPLIAAQGGHGTQWIGRWALSSRLQAIPQYFLTGYMGSPLGHGIELLVALPILAALVWGGLHAFDRSRHEQQGVEPRCRRGAWITLSLAVCGVLIPVVLAAAGADYLAPRNLVAAMIPVTALIALACTWPRSGTVGLALAGAIALLFLAITLDTDRSPRLQRGNWRGVAASVPVNGSERAITTVELGAAPLEYYMPGLHNMKRGSTVRLREIVETGYSPLRASAGEPPAHGFHLLSRRDVDGLIVYRFRSSSPRLVSEAVLRRQVITLAHPEVLVLRPLS